MEVVKTIENGYIKLHRKMVNWEWFSDPNTSHLFVYLLLSASWQDSKWRGIDIPRGSLITSLSHLAENTGLSIQSVRTSLNKLKSTNELTYKSTNKFTLVTIVKYSDYQDTDFTNQQANQQANQQTTNKQLTTSKEYKEYKNIRNKDIYMCDSNESEKTTTKTKKFSKPTVEEIKQYCLERKNNIDSQQFYDYYEANGWKVGKNPMKDWKACIRTWERNNYNKTKSKYDVLDNLDLDSNPFDF